MLLSEGEKMENELCMNIAPIQIAVCVPPDKNGMLKTPWCHLLKGHEGPHQCGEWRWK
jgi:hypothetical protein